MAVHNIGTEHLHKTWFLLPNGTIDEIDMAVWEISEAMELARQLGAYFFWRRLREHRADLTWDWGCYRTYPAPGMVGWRPKGKIEPFKVVRSPDGSAAEMLCRMKAATT